jgi:DNA mismatch repair protein MSH5
VIPGDVHAYDDYEEDNYANAGTGREAQLLKFSGWISVDSQVTVGCAGAILCYLQKRRTSRYLPGDPAAQGYFRVSTIEMFSMKGIMCVESAE